MRERCRCMSSKLRNYLSLILLVQTFTQQLFLFNKWQYLGVKQYPVRLWAKISNVTISISQVNFLLVFYDTKEYKLCLDVKCLLIHGHNWISLRIRSHPFRVRLQKIGGWCEAVQCKLHLLYSHNVVYENILLATAYLSEGNTDWIGTDPHVDTL